MDATFQNGNTVDKEIGFTTFLKRRWWQECWGENAKQSLLDGRLENFVSKNVQLQRQCYWRSMVCCKFITY